MSLYNMITWPASLSVTKSSTRQVSIASQHTQCLLTLVTGKGSLAMAYVKASTRDMKAYRDSKGYRKAPIGYSAGELSPSTHQGSLTVYSRHCYTPSNASGLPRVR